MNKQLRFLWVSITVFTVCYSSFADKITVHNETALPIFAAVYCKTPKSSASKSTDVLPIAASGSVELDRTSGGLTCRRQLLVSKDGGALSKKISDADFYAPNKYGTASLGTTSGEVSRLQHNFYVSTAGEGFTIENTTARKLSKIRQAFGDIVDGAVNIYKTTLLHTNPAVIANPYAETVAHFRHSNTLPDEERAYLAARLPKVKAALDTMLGRRLKGNYIPKIAFVASGGGARAMLSTVGWHDGAQRIGLLDAVTYDAGLSGGTWGIGFWLASGLSIQDYQTLLKQQMTKGLLPVKGMQDTGTTAPTKQESWLMMQAVLAKMSFDQPVGLVDFYGSLLANTFMSQKEGTRQVFALHDLKDAIKTGDRPMPIFTAINGDDGTHQKNRHLVRWVEFSPFEVGAPWLGGFVPSWAYGREFDTDGKSVDFAPPISFGFQAGTYGSAFAFDFRRAMEVALNGISNELVRMGLTKMIEKLSNESAEDFGGKRMSTAKVNNFAKGSPGADEDMRDKDILRFGDGGLAFNLPYPPVSGERPERLADVMIFLDASGSLEKTGSSEMKLAIDYARAKGLKLPNITIKDLEKRDVSVFINEADPTVPVVIYIPRRLNITKQSTTKFVYTGQEFEVLVGNARDQMQTGADKIKQAIIKKIELNRGF